jgi:hypothetical protein
VWLQVGAASSAERGAEDTSISDDPHELRAAANSRAGSGVTDTAEAERVVCSLPTENGPGCPYPPWSMIDRRVSAAETSPPGTAWA